ncbi:hypothetical protein J6590_049551 [Homalodisca vitripennis]|nr:hypothetical protein J6590_049551 [Homalodisca vitripennis]
MVDPHLCSVLYLSTGITKHWSCDSRRVAGSVSYTGHAHPAYVTEVVMVDPHLCSVLYLTTGITKHRSCDSRRVAGSQEGSRKCKLCRTCSPGICHCGGYGRPSPVFCIISPKGITKQRSCDKRRVAGSVGYTGHAHQVYVTVVVMADPHLCSYYIS